MGTWGTVGLSPEPDTPVLFQKAFSLHNVEGLYLLTNGKPDTSCNLILREVQRLREAHDVRVHTISLSSAGRWGSIRLCPWGPVLGARHQEGLAGAQ